MSSNYQGVIGKCRATHDASVIKDQKRHLLCKSKNELLRRERYVASLNTNNLREIEGIASEGHFFAEQILRKEAKNALKSMKLGKANGENRIRADSMVKISCPAIDFLVTKIYEEGELPIELPIKILKSTSILLPRKLRAQ